VREYKYLGYKLQRNGGVAGNSCERKGDQSSCNNKSDVGNWKEKVWEGLKKNLAFRCTGMNSGRIQSENLGMKGEIEIGESAEEVYEMGSGSRGRGDISLSKKGWKESK